MYQPNLHLTNVSNETAPDPTELYWLLSKLATYALSQRGYSIEEIATAFGMAHSHLYVIWDAFERDGLDGLVNNPNLVDYLLRQDGPQVTYNMLDSARRGNEEQHWFALPNNDPSVSE